MCTLYHTLPSLCLISACLECRGRQDCTVESDFGQSEAPTPPQEVLLVCPLAQKCQWVYQGRPVPNLSAWSLPGIGISLWMCLMQPPSVCPPLQQQCPVWSCLSLKRCVSEHFCRLPTEAHVSRNIPSFLNLGHNLHYVLVVLKHCRKEGNRLYWVHGAFAWAVGSCPQYWWLVNGDITLRVRSRGSSEVNHTAVTHPESSRFPGPCPALAFCRFSRYKGQFKK